MSHGVGVEHKCSRCGVTDPCRIEDGSCDGFGSSGLCDSCLTDRYYDQLMQEDDQGFGGDYPDE